VSAGIAPNVATAAGWGDRPPPRRMRLISWRPVRSGKLLGFASVELLGIGLRLFELPLFAGTNGPWAALPRKARLDREKRQRLDANGSPEFEPVAEWKDRASADAFSAAVISVIRAAYPDALDGDAP
jgi:hypothetical protein